MQHQAPMLEADLRQHGWTKHHHSLRELASNVEADISGETQPLYSG